MSITDSSPIPGDRISYIEWAPIFAGAVAAAALSFLLLTFGSAIGLSITSPWPQTGVRLWVVALAVMWWMVIVQIGSFAAGGYLAGRMRSRWGTATTPESQFRDSAHGLLVWAVGVLVGAIVLAIVGMGTVKTAIHSSAVVTSGSMHNDKAQGPAEYAVDILLRPQPGNADPKTTSSRSDDGLIRAEANRIFATGISEGALSQRDYDYLTQIVAARTGLPQAEAQRRVQLAVHEAQSLEAKARDTADKARKAAILTAFTAAASLLISLVAAITAAAAGGRHRDENKMPLFSGHQFW